MLNELKKWLYLRRGRRFLDAASRRSARVLKTFLDNGMNPDFHEESGTTALVLAANVHHTKAVKLLLSRGADPNIRNSYGATALLWAARNGDRESLEALLDNGANPNLQNTYGLTPLMLAARNGDRVSVCMLLNKGAHLNLENEVGQTAFSYAEENGHGDIVDILEGVLLHRRKGLPVSMAPSAGIKNGFRTAVMRKARNKPEPNARHRKACIYAVKI